MTTPNTASDPPNAAQRRRETPKPQPKNQSQQHVPHVERLAWPIAEGARRIGVGRTSIYKLAAEGKLRLVRIGGRTLLPEEEIIRLIADAGDEAVVWTPRLRPRVTAECGTRAKSEHKARTRQLTSRERKEARDASPS
jgi:excisionase family DNA binding protein